MVDRDDVDDQVRGGRELGQFAAPVGEDQRLRHLEALDPARMGALEGGLDDAGPDDRHRSRLGVRLDDPLPQRLGEGVAVRPAEAAGPLGAGPHQLGADPLAPLLLRRRRRGDRSGATVLLLGGFAQPSEMLGRPRPVLDDLPLREPPDELLLEVDVVVDGTFRDGTAAPPSDVGRRDVHVVDARAQLGHSGEQVAGADDVGGERLVDRWVERHVSSAVHDGGDVFRQGGYVGQVALDDHQPGLDEGFCSPGGLDHLGEDRLGERRGDAVAAGRRALGPDQHGERRLRRLGQHPVEQGLPDEARDTREQDRLAAQALSEPGCGLLAHPRSLASVIPRHQPRSAAPHPALRRSLAALWSGAASPVGAVAAVVAALDESPGGGERESGDAELDGVGAEERSDAEVERLRRAEVEVGGEPGRPDRVDDNAARHHQQQGAHHVAVGPATGQRADEAGGHDEAEQVAEGGPARSAAVVGVPGDTRHPGHQVEQHGRHSPD